ncbi:MAG: cell wall-binding repeat-containing protein [Candidatus Nanohaloarchaea archaeon]|nr:cell wall-binding repeat-containing protein [Candidatus Nanohaloarchaea archaeon]
MRRKLALLAVLGILLTTAAAATSHTTNEAMDPENINTVIVTSTANYPDALVATPAASKLGVPILLTNKNQLPQATEQALKTFSPSKVVLIGGELVISQQVESQLSTNYNVTRLWGMTRYGTAVQVAEYFWPEGSDSAMLVENERTDQRGNVLSLAKELARDREDPLFLTPSGEIPATVLSQLEQLGVEEVTYVGTNLSASAESQLQELNITVEERIVGSSDQELETELRRELGERINASAELTVVATSGFRHSIAAVNAISSDTYLVRNEQEVSGAVSLVKKNSIDRVHVVGEPDLAETIAARLRSETNATVRRNGFRADASAEFAASFSENETARFRNLHARRYAQWKNELERQDQQMQERANRTINRAQSLVKKVNASGTEAETALMKAEALYSKGRYFQAMRAAHEAIEETREARWGRIKDNRTRFRKEMREEMMDMKEKTRELREINHEFAEEMRENMTVEERLETIQEFKEKRRDQLRELLKNVMEGRKGSLRERLERAEREAADFSYEIKTDCGDSYPVSSVSRFEIKPHEGSIETRGRLGLKTPGYHGKVTYSINASARTVSFNVVYSPFEGFTIQCLADSRFKARLDVPSGVWHVTSAVTVDGTTLKKRSRTVNVSKEEGEDEGELSERLKEKMREFEERKDELREKYLNGTDLNETEQTGFTYRLEATDDAFYMDGEQIKRLKIPAGEKVELTFHTRKENVYSAGHEYHAYRGDSDNLVLFKVAGPNDPGESSTVSFTAGKNFTIQAYWPEDGTPKTKLSVDVATGWCERQGHGSTITSCTDPLTAGRKTSEYCESHDCPSPDTYTASCAGSKVVACTG